MGKTFRLEYDILGGADTLNNEAEIPQGPGSESWKGVLHMAQANNVFQPHSRHDLQTRPGMADVRSTAINAAGIFTGMIWQGSIADRFLMTVSIAAGSHNIYVDDANPPSAVAAGTNFTIGADNLVTGINFTDGTNQGTILMSLLMDTPQFVNSSGTRSDFTITDTFKPKFGDVLGQRALYVGTKGGTNQPKRVYWSDIRNGDSITDPTVQFESFENRLGEDISCLKSFGDVAMVGNRHQFYVLAVTTAAAKPFALREFPIGLTKGPIGSHSAIEVDGVLYWMGLRNIHSLDPNTLKFKDLADNIKPTIAGLSETRRAYTIAGYDPQNGLILFAVSNSGESTNKRIIAVNPKTGAVYPNWTLSVNAMALRFASSVPYLIMGGYVGKFRNFPSGTTGDLDDATAVIDADVITPRHHANAPDWVKLFEGVTVVWDLQSSEDVTLQYRMNDDSSWTSFAESPYSVTGTAGHVDVKHFPLMQVGTHLQLRFRDTISGDVFRVQKYILHGQYLYLKTQ